MLTEKTDMAAELRVSSNGIISVLERTVILRDDTPIGTSNHRYPLSPGDDLTSKDPRIVAVANATWTPEVIEAWKAQQAATDAA